MYNIDITSPIIPDKTIGNIFLRDKISVLKRKILVSDKSKYELASPFEAAYLFEDNTIEVTVDVRYGRIYKITACKGYKGKLFDEIEVGMSSKFILGNFKDFYFDDDEDLILNKKINGISLDVTIVNGIEIVQAISVFANEFIKAEETGKELNFSNS